MAHLLDQLRTLAAQGAPARVIVFAAVEPGAAARRVVTGLAARARALDLAVAVGELTRRGAQALLVERDSTPRAGRALELDGAGLAAALQTWLEPNAAAQMVLIEAPPVAASVDALLLAGACDGIVLVAETGATARAALRAAADRVRHAGCRALGVVLTRQN
jgi:Mrp family chromosome partitioning ATPase